MSLSAIMFLRGEIKSRRKAEGVRLSETDLALLVRNEWTTLTENDQLKYEAKPKTMWICDPNSVILDCGSSNNKCTDYVVDSTSSYADLPVLKAVKRPVTKAEESFEAQPDVRKRIMAGQLVKQISKISWEDPAVSVCTSVNLIDSINAASESTIASLKRIAGYESEIELQNAISEYGLHSYDSDMVESVRMSSHGGATPVKKHSVHHRAGQRSQYYHVTHDPYRPGKWKTYIRHPGGRCQFFGPFDTEEEAAHSYDALARLEFGEDAKTNFDAHGTRIIYTERPYQHSEKRKWKKKRRDTELLVMPSYDI